MIGVTIITNYPCYSIYVFEFPSLLILFILMCEFGNELRNIQAVSRTKLLDEKLPKESIS